MINLNVRKQRNERDSLLHHFHCSMLLTPRRRAFSRNVEVLLQVVESTVNGYVKLTVMKLCYFSKFHSEINHEVAQKYVWQSFPNICSARSFHDSVTGISASNNSSIWHTLVSWKFPILIPVKGLRFPIARSKACSCFHFKLLRVVKE